MAIDPYASCPCGSGKKFKWCCQPIYGGIDKAFGQHENGQHEAAIQTMSQVVAANSSNPEAYGRQALLLYNLSRAEEAEAALNKAFSINANYPFGLYLRGQFRLAEQKPAEAIKLFRTAAKVYDPLARQQLGALYARIAEVEMRLKRPVASKASLRIAMHYDSTTPEYKQIMDSLFGAETKMPWSACKDYTFKAPPENTPRDKQKTWKQALTLQNTGNLNSVLQTFEQLTTDDPENPAAWYNLGLTRAWLGDNGAAIEAFDEYFRLESDEKQAIETWALTEVLRCGEGVDVNETDHVDYNRIYEIKDGNRFMEALRQLESDGRMVGAQMREQEQVLTAILTEPPSVLVAGGTRTEPLRFAAHFLLAGGMIRLSSVNHAALLKIAHEFEERFGDAIAKDSDAEDAPFLSDVLSEALVFPYLDNDTPDAKTKAQQQSEAGIAEFFEQTWLRRPLHALSGVQPVDAVGTELLRKKLQGVVLFLEECASAQSLPYDFDRLRRKLGLLEAQPAASDSPDIAALSAAELAQLDTATLSPADLERAYQTAQRLDARDLGMNFLKQRVERPAEDDTSDRFPWYRQLIQFAVNERQFDDAMAYVDNGESFDCEYNEGRHRNDYELWRGRVHARCGDIDAAQAIFDSLIARQPDEVQYHTTAAEAMISAKENERARQFAQSGLELARKQQNRDSEQHLMELSAAAERT